MSMNQLELERIIGEVLQPRGFRKDKTTWSRTNDDVIALVNLQKSQWGGQYYLNVAWYLRLLESPSAPKEHKAHVRTRLTSIPQVARETLEAALDLEREGVNDDARRRTIQGAIADILLPLLDANSTLSQLRQSYSDGALREFSVIRGAREILSESN
jgi:hypothetical protein